MATVTKKPVKKSAPKTKKVPKAKAAPKADTQLPKELFGATINKQLLAQSVRVYLANQRVGTAKTKTRGEVEGSTRKIYRQKGTGRARHGSIRAPIFVGGGIVFGPVPRDYHLKMNKSMKRNALVSALSAKAIDTVVLGGLDHIEPKTKEVVSLFSKEGITGKILVVVAKSAHNLVRAARNMQDVTLIGARDLNPYALLTHEKIVFTQKSLEESVSHFTQKQS